MWGGFLVCLLGNCSEHSVETTWEVTVCVIMHNMIMDDEHDDDQGWNYKDELIEPRVDMQHLNSSSNFIMKWVIGQLTFNYKMIWLRMYGLM